MLAEVWSGALVGVEGVPVRVEVSASGGLPGVSVVGLPQSAVREGRERVRSALLHAGFRIPPRRVTVNLAPADLKKEGSGFDLPLAIGLLAGTGQLSTDELEGMAFLGELGLNGELRPVRGALAVAAACFARGLRGLVVPEANAREAAAHGSIEVRGATSLTAVVEDLTGRRSLDVVSVDLRDALRIAPERGADLADIRGQQMAKRALEIAAAGGHNLLFTGPPGSGKTLLARALAGILPPLTPSEALEVTAVHSAAGLLPLGEAIVVRRPFRSPHHTISGPGLVGGGTPIRPGEVSLAHRGVLFMDELPEFSRRALETLRQPLEDGWVGLVRARERVRFPARFALVAAMNPCPCGRAGASSTACTCDPSQVARYRSRISGPLLDRIDLRVEVQASTVEDLMAGRREEASEAVRGRVLEARGRQNRRAARRGRGSCNADLDHAELVRWCEPDAGGRRMLSEAGGTLALSARGMHRTLRVARTIADLEGSGPVREADIAEALQYRARRSSVAGS